LESLATSAAKASEPTPECDAAASTVPSFKTICDEAAADKTVSAAPMTQRRSLICKYMVVSYPKSIERPSSEKPKYQDAQAYARWLLLS
jgi:hypothetical protein